MFKMSSFMDVSRMLAHCSCYYNKTSNVTVKKLHG